MMNRHTLSERLLSDVGLTVQEFSDKLGVNEQTIRNYHKHNRLMLKIIVSGYQASVMCQPISDCSGADL